MRSVPYRPWRWTCYSRQVQDSKICPMLKAKTSDMLEGRVTFYCDDLVPTGFTGVVWACAGPTGWSGGRLDKDYVVPGGTGVLTMQGDTGPRGAYDVFWHADISGFTGVADGQWYGLQIGTNTESATGPHFTAELGIRVRDTFK